MKPEDLAKLFQQTWSAETPYLPKARCVAGPIRGVLQQRIYSLSELPELITILKSLEDGFDPNDEEVFSVRYLVSLDKQLLFAREGRTDRFIPSHKQMRSACLAAGNIYFS